MMWNLKFYHRFSYYLLVKVQTHGLEMNQSFWMSFLAKSIPHWIKRFLELFDIFILLPLYVNTFNWHSPSIFDNIEVWTFGWRGLNFIIIVNNPFFNSLRGINRSSVLLIDPVFSSPIGFVKELCFQVLYIWFCLSMIKTKLDLPPIPTASHTIKHPPPFRRIE